MVARLTKLFTAFCRKGQVPQDLKDASIIDLYKRKENRQQCDNHRGISLLSIAGKILARVILNRITNGITNIVYPESQCGFCSGRGPADMIFAYWQLQEKCLKQNKPLYTEFVELTKVFDTISTEELWKLLHKVGCQEKLIAIIRSFHNGMPGRIFDSSKFSKQFSITDGVKEGFPHIIQYRLCTHATARISRSRPYSLFSSKNVFNLRCSSAHTKVTETSINDFLFPDDCALSADSPDDIQLMVDRFADAAKNFGLTISLKKRRCYFSHVLTAYTAILKSRLMAQN